MRKLVLAVAVLAIGIACSSKSKVSDPQAPKTTTDANATKGQPKDSAKAQKEKAAPQAGTIMCKHEKDERSIEVQAKGTGCEVMYTKMGETKSVATAAHGNQHCQDVASKIEKNLTGAGYSCQ